MVLGGHSTASTQSLGQPHGGGARSSVYSVPCNGFFPKIGPSWFLLQSVVARSRAGLGVKRMRELCALYRTSGSNYSWLTSVKLRKASWLKMWMKNKITIFCQQVRWKHFFLYLAFLDFFFFVIWNLCSFIFQLPDPLPLFSFHCVWYQEYEMWIPRFKRGRVTFRKLRCSLLWKGT